MELEVYRQEDNLFRAINRWRRDDAADWVVEYTTGSFDLDERDKFIISEEGPATEDRINTGFFVGEMDDGRLCLNYVGQGDGVSFGVELRRKGR